MTGDISKRITDKYLKSRLKSHYYILKAPHHGTKSQFSKHLLRSDKILISTGYTTSRCGKIYINYEAKIKTDGKRICSAGDTFCEVRDKNRTCVNSSCCKKSIIVLPVINITVLKGTKRIPIPYINFKKHKLRK